MVPVFSLITHVLWEPNVSSTSSIVSIYALLLAYKYNCTCSLLDYDEIPVGCYEVLSRWTFGTPNVMLILSFYLPGKLDELSRLLTHDRELDLGRFLFQTISDHVVGCDQPLLTGFSSLSHPDDKSEGFQIWGWPWSDVCEQRRHSEVRRVWTNISPDRFSSEEIPRVFLSPQPGRFWERVIFVHQEEKDEV